MFTHREWWRRAAAAGPRIASGVAAATLLACGGGGGSSGSAPAPPGTVPAVTLTSPANLATGLTGILALGASPAAGAAIESVEFQVDGAAVGAAVTSAPYTVSVDAGAYASGQHVLCARARDASGNASSWVTATVQFGGNLTQPAGFTRNEAFATGLVNAAAFAQAPDGRFFVAEQGGTLRVVKGGAVLATPFVSLAVDASGERGLIGVTLHPGFASNGYVYVYYTTTDGGPHNRISRFTASGDTASVGSEARLVDLPALSSATNHNGGGMHFGADGKLYVGVGENADGSHSQDLSSPLGKLLRLNDDGSIPADNPFAPGATGLAGAVWAYGLRNPFTFAVQPGTGRIHINDVGQNTWEEIDLGAAGANYGWPGSEGPDNVAAGITGPMFTYAHANASPPGSGPGGFFVGDAIAGGTFYPDAGPFPATYQGSYFFADYVNRFIGRYDVANGAAYAFGTVGDNPVDMLTGQDGALYVLTRGGITRFSAP